ncbi:TPA: nucleoside 2-deoxyribosyltransferase [Enterococcus faecium]|nr:nucleoside 2-deoxyribosyltransferase [Enterococcus faecium]HCI0920157.1 nucleoside 2-deoxyribosyltransferase [Enterococcus faecium]HCI0943352.1 nucleoside 2-deoxyribosyltransferase [Enterococcus faecium]HCI0946545.1 nucleoside 2-deoxyribosyltransferase [Enterococcus faecium]HCI0955495.1 nucleoside 2-deoxyribosyltransferase [Enterococcus faecium]
MKIYFAAPMFAKSDLLYNQQLVKEIRELSSELSIYLPQENEAINDKTAYADSRMIALADTEKVLASDLMIVTIDAGVASEIGVAYAKGIPVIGLYTDTRQQGGTHPKKIAALQETAENQFHYLNLYTIGLIKLNGKVVSSEIELLSEVKRFLDGGTFSD